MRERGFRALLALMVALMVVSAGATAPASADHVDFDEGKWGTVFGWTVGFSVWTAEKGINYAVHEVLNLGDGDENAHVDLYDAASGQETQFENTRLALQDYNQDSRTFAFVKAENASIEAIAAGDTKSSVNTTARNTVHDYYAEAQQGKWLDGWEIATEQLKTVHTKAVDHSTLHPDNVTGGEVTSTGHGTYSDDCPCTHDIWVSNFSTTTVTQVNGTSRDVMTVEMSTRTYLSNGNQVGGTQTWEFGPTTGNKSRIVFGDQTDGITTEVHSVDILKPEGSSLTNFTYYDFDTTKAEYQEFTDTSTMVADNAGVYAEKLHDGQNNGTIDAANYTSPYVLAQEYASDYNSTGYWSYAIAMLSSTGTATPDLNQTGMMEVSYNGNIYHGLVMASQFPNGTLESGTAYDGSNTSGFGERAWLVTDSGQRLVLDGEFTIREMEDKEGNVINQTKEVKYVYQGVNVTEYKEQQKLIQELRDELQDREPVGTGSGSSDGFWPPFGLSQAQAAVGGAAIVGLGLLGMSGGTTGRRRY